MAYRHQRGEITRLEPGRGERPMLQMVAEFNDHGLAVIIGKPQRIDRVRRKNAPLVVVASKCQAAIRPQHFQELFIILGDRKRDVSGKSVSVRVDLVCGRILKKKGTM